MQDKASAIRAVVEEGLLAGTIAGLLSAGVLAIAGKRDAGSPYIPANAESQWLWGSESFRDSRPSLRHTVTGAMTHHLSTIFWATLHAAVARALGRQGNLGVAEALAGGAATSAAAAVIDYGLVPERLQPGFERTISRQSTVAAFAAIAVGIAAGALLMRGRR